VLTRVRSLFSGPRRLDGYGADALQALCGARDRNRTGTPLFSKRRILSPLRLPISPLWHESFEDIRTSDETLHHSKRGFASAELLIRGTRKQRQ
jgi:hypothetical protein